MDNDFENIIKQTIDNHPKYPIDYGMFDDIVIKLEAPNDDRPIGFGAWIIPFFAGLLLSGLGVYLWTNFNKDRLHVNEQQLSHIVVDTNFSHQNIIIYDTIYKQVTVSNGSRSVPNTIGQHSLSPDNTESNIRNSESLAFYKNFYRKYNLHSSFKASNRSYERDNHFNLIAYKNRESSQLAESNNTVQNHSETVMDNHTSSMINMTRGNMKRSAFEPIARLDLLDLDDLELERERVRIVHNRFWNRLLRKDNPSGLLGLFASINTFLKPKYYTVNINGGYVLPLNLKNLKENFQFDFDIELGFDDNWSFVTGVSSLSYGFEKQYNGIDINTLTDYPIIEDAHPGDVLDRISGEFKILQIPIGIKYQLGKKYRLTPIFSGGLMCQIPTMTSLDYYFTGNFAYERKQKNVLKYKGLFTDYWTSVGLLYHYNSKFGLKLSTSYQGSFKKGKYDFENSQLVNFAIGIRYKL